MTRRPHAPRCCRPRRRARWWWIRQQHPPAAVAEQVRQLVYKLMTLTVAELATTVFRLPMAGELQWGSHSRLAEARHVLVRATLSDGSVGVAEAPPRPTIYGETAATICAIVREELAPRVVGQPVAGAWERLQQVKNNHTAKGAVDMALHDALAASRGVTLAEHLGATQQQVRVQLHPRHRRPRCRAGRGRARGAARACACSR